MRIGYKPHFLFVLFNEIGTYKMQLIGGYLRFANGLHSIL